MQSMDRTTAAELTAHLERLITTERIARVREVLENRTRYVCLVLEDIYKSHSTLYSRDRAHRRDNMRKFALRWLKEESGFRVWRLA